MRSIVQGKPWVIVVRNCQHYLFSRWSNGHNDRNIVIKILYCLPNGITIYESQLISSTETKGIVGGPRRVFTEIDKGLKGTHRECIFDRFGKHLSEWV